MEDNSRMFSNRLLKAGVSVMLTGTLFIAACDSTTTANTPLTAQGLVNAAKSDIAAKDYAAALQKCLSAEEKDDTNAEAKYCVMLANVGALVQSVSAIIGLVASQLSPAEYQANAFNVKSIVSSILSDIEGQMRYIDIYAAKLAAFEDPTITLEDFPLGLDPKDLLDLIGDSVQVSGDLSLNMKGTWDKSEVMVMGAAVNGVQGLLDYLLAHKLVLASTDIDFDSTEGVANFLFNNPDLLIADAADKSRIAGDGDKRKGLKNDVLAALSFAVGRDSDLDKVAPKNGGLVAAIKQSAAAARPDAVVVWVDKDKDGIPEEVGIPAINDIKDNIKDSDGKPLIEGDTFENPISKATWDVIIALGKDVRDNVEADGGDAIALQPVLQAIADEALAEDAVSTVRLLHRPVPNLLGLNPGSFFKAPKYIAELVPYYFQYTTGTTDLRADIAIEIETYVSATTWFNEKVGYEAYKGAVSDFTHFDYGTPDDLVGLTVDSYDFGDFTVPTAIAEDGVKADVKSPILFQIALQDAGLGGLLQGAPAADGAFGALDNAKLNKGLAQLIKYYCLDFNVADVKDADGEDVGILGVFDDVNYGAGNKIAACTNGF